MSTLSSVIKGSSGEELPEPPNLNELGAETKVEVLV